MLVLWLVRRSPERWWLWLWIPAVVGVLSGVFDDAVCDRSAVQPV